MMKIIENSKEYLHDFIRLNELWIKKYFTIEQTDKNLAAHPYKVIEDGGFIFYLVLDGEVLGVCALFNEGDGVFELARMAVSPAHQGKGYGGVLIGHCLLKLKQLGAKNVYLVSNTKLNAAIGLYKKYGFKVLRQGPHPVYARANIVMEYDSL